MSHNDWNDERITGHPHVDADAPGVRAAAENIHANESLHRHDPRGTVCVYCAINATRAVRVAVGSGALIPAEKVIVTSELDGRLECSVLVKERNAARAALDDIAFLIEDEHGRLVGDQLDVVRDRVWSVLDREPRQARSVVTDAPSSV